MGIKHYYMENGQEDLTGRLMNYRFRWLEKLGIPRHGHLHLWGRSGDWYVFPYRKYGTIEGKEDTDSKRIRAFWAFLDGDMRYRPYFYKIYLRAVRQLLWITKRVWSFEIASVPRSDPSAENPVRSICSEIAKREEFLFTFSYDGTDLLKRTKKVVPVHRGGRFTIDEIEKSIQCTRRPKSDLIILVDDLVYSGRTIEACRRVLKRAGAKKVYSICLYGYRRED